MDAVIHFRLPDELRPLRDLLRHLGEHRRWATSCCRRSLRCVLSGGQLRNVALHARLLALDGGGRLGDDELRRAIEREYRKVDGSLPAQAAAQRGELR